MKNYKRPTKMEDKKQNRKYNKSPWTFKFNLVIKYVYELLNSYNLIKTRNELKIIKTKSIK